MLFPFKLVELDLKLDLELRAYQRNILDTARRMNTLVVLPTGLGKTLIALSLALERLSLHPNSKALFLAPTRPLLAQHASFLLEHSPIKREEIAVLTGKMPPRLRAHAWEKAKFIFATPQCIKNDLRQGRVSLKNVSVIAFDECHRAIGDYAYVYIADRYAKDSLYPRIIGLTASPGYTREHIWQVCENLYIERIEARSEEDVDVLPYVKAKQVERVWVSLPSSFVEVREMLRNCLKKRLMEMKEEGIIGSISLSRKDLLSLQEAYKKKVEGRKADFKKLMKISACIKLAYALELLETQSLSSFLRYAREVCAANRGASKMLAMDIDFRRAVANASEMAGEVEHPKLSLLKRIVEREGGKKIIFAHFRETAKLICELIPSSRLFIGQAKGGMSQKEQLEAIEEFKTGAFDTLVCTSIGEEGLHIPEADVAIFYEPVPSALRDIQRKGRVGRVKAGRVYILITRKTSDEAYYWTCFRRERRMFELISNLNRLLSKQGIQRRLFEYAPHLS